MSEDNNHVEWPNYDQDFYESDEFNSLGISQGREIDQDDLERIELAYNEYTLRHNRLEAGEEAETPTPDDIKIPWPQMSKENQFLNSTEFKDLHIVKTDEISREDYQRVRDAYASFLERLKLQDEEALDNMDDSLHQAENSTQEEEGEALEFTPAVEDPEWLQKYDERLTQLGKDNNNAWDRDGSVLRGLAGSFANGTTIYYTSPNKLKMSCPTGKTPKAEHFKEIVAIAKENDQDVQFGPKMSPAFKRALIEACATAGVMIDNMSEEDLALYDSFLKPQQGQQEAQVEEPASEILEKAPGDFKINARVTQTRLREYEYQYDKNKENFEKKNQGLEDTLEKGWFNEYASGISGESKAKSEILLRKYVVAEANGNEEDKKLYETALKYYGLDTISRQPVKKKTRPGEENTNTAAPEEKGPFVITVKDYDTRNDEEKKEISAAYYQVFPKEGTSNGAEQQGRHEGQTENGTNEPENTNNTNESVNGNTASGSVNGAESNTNTTGPVVDPRRYNGGNTY